MQQVQSGQTAQTAQTATQAAPSAEAHGGKRLGAFLCWAVVFADIGTSIYYVPGILYGQVNRLAGLFVLLTMLVFLLLVLKYAEVSVRFPEGGGVVTVAARALHPWAGAVGGMFILVDYFLTAAISSLSGLQYFSAIVPRVGPFVLIGALAVLVLLGILNWWGIKESASFSAVIAVAALVSDLLIILLVLLNYTPAEIFATFGKMFSGTPLTSLTLLTGFSGAFLAFSGLESISQLSPVMRVPRSKTVSRALALVAITVGITSPLLTIFSTILLTTPLSPTHGIPAPFTHTPVDTASFISELARAYGGPVLEVATAVAASALLVFASNTAIIGAYHVFLALSRMRFFPAGLQKMSQSRETPYVAIILATGIPMLVLIAVRGSIEVLGNLYAFGLLGAFILTCVSLDVIRWRERHQHVLIGAHVDPELLDHTATATPAPTSTTITGIRASQRLQWAEPARQAARRLWPDARYYLGFLTTLLVAIAWVTNLFSKPDATLFGGGLTLLGLGVALINYRALQRGGAAPVFPLTLLRPIPHSIMVALPASSTHTGKVMRAAIGDANGHPLVFVYLAEHRLRTPTPEAFQFGDPYLYDTAAQHIFSRAATLAQRAGVSASFVYRVGGPELLSDVWRVLRPDEVMVEAGATSSLARFVAPDYVRYTFVDSVRVAHYIHHHLRLDAGERPPEVANPLRTRPTPPLTAPRRSNHDQPLIPGQRVLHATSAPPRAARNGHTPEPSQDDVEWTWTGTDLIRRDQPPTNG